MKRFYGLIVCILSCLASPIYAQQFENGELDGDATSSSNVPYFWENVLFSDPICNAENDFGASPDVTDINGPIPNNGILGQPYSGETFITALYGPGHHEGIQQLVSGFTPGVIYDISYYQSVVKQISVDAVDTTGSWAVYVDADLAGIGEMTTSLLPPLDVNLIWEHRSISFTASSTSHLIKFIPADDDTVLAGNSENGMLRIGLDLINLSFHTSADEHSLQSKLNVFPNPFKDSFKLDLTSHNNNVLLEVFNAQGQMVWQERLTSNRLHDISINGEPGVYLARLRDESGETATMRLVME